MPNAMSLKMLLVVTLLLDCLILFLTESIVHQCSTVFDTWDLRGRVYVVTYEWIVKCTSCIHSYVVFDSEDLFLNLVLHGKCYEISPQSKQIWTGRTITFLVVQITLFSLHRWLVIWDNYLVVTNKTSCCGVPMFPSWHLVLVNMSVSSL
jgi:hypothetical protein